MLTTRTLRIMLILMLALPAGLPAMEADSMHVTVASDTCMMSDRPRKNIIKRIIDYFGKANVPRTDGKLDISFIGGPHYSSDVGFGLAVLASGLYGHVVSDSVTGRSIQSETSLFLDVSTTGFVSVGSRGTHVFANEDKRIDYNLNFSNFPQKYWGIGYENAIHKDNFSKYDEVSLSLEASMSFRLWKQLYIGPSLDIRWINANKVRERSIWNQDNDFHMAVVGVGATLSYDTRNSITAPSKGSYITLEQRIYPSFLGNGDHHFFIIDMAINKYAPLWRSASIAGRLHAAVTWGETPWCMLPTFGNGGDMRGYYPGRYRDQNEMNVTVELRQHIWKRSGIVVWAGAGTVFSRLSSLTFKHVLPNVGLGYRWEFKRNSNVRVDFGIGKGETGFVFNINEAF